jgi:phosphate acetyltransferase
MSETEMSAPHNSAPSAFLSHATGDCPPDLLARATAGTPPAFVFVRAIGDAVLQTARQAHAANLIRPILVGEPGIIADDAQTLGWDLACIEIVESTGEKGAIDAAIKLIQDGRAIGLIKGQLHTDVFMGGIVKRDAGIRIGKRLVHVFAMLPPAGGRALLISDAAVNVAPDIETRTEAALLMADLVRKLGQERPKVAVLSATESVLDAVPSSGDARMIANMAGARDDQADYAGPLSLDLAISPDAVAMKKLDADASVVAVAGMADALVVPDIVSGNVLFKSLVWCAGGLAAGLVLGGGVPIVLTSRSDPPAARLASIALAVIAGKD